MQVGKHTLSLPLTPSLTRSIVLLNPIKLVYISTLLFLLDVKRCNAGVKLLMRFASKIIDKYNALPEEERDTSSILGHLVRMQVSHESERVADAVGNNYLYHNLSYGILISLSLILSL